MRVGFGEVIEFSDFDILKYNIRNSFSERKMKTLLWCFCYDGEYLQFGTGTGKRKRTKMVQLEFSVGCMIDAWKAV
jgi:hypothetical protein